MKISIEGWCSENKLSAETHLDKVVASLNQTAAWRISVISDLPSF